MVVPVLKVLPEGMDGVTVTAEQLSLANGVFHVAVAVQTPAGTFVEILEGQNGITGGVESCTLTVKEQVEVFPTASAAV